MIAVRSTKRLAVALCVGTNVLSCATMTRESGYSEVEQWVQERQGYAGAWKTGSPDSEKIQTEVARYLDGELDREKLIRVALLHAPVLQALYAELGVSQAEAMEMTLLKNPALGLSLRWPIEGSGINAEFSLVQEFLDLLMLSAKRDIAHQQFEIAKLRLAQEVLATLAETEAKYYEYISAQQIFELQRSILSSFEAAEKLADAQRAAGAIGELEWALQKSESERVRLDVAQDELRYLELREELNRLLGLWGPQTQWKITAKLEDLPQQESSYDNIESLAMRRRLDLEAARQRVLLLRRALELASSSRLVGTVEVGVSGERDAEGSKVLGPSLVLELPIFDRRQPMLRRLEAQLQEGEFILQQKAVTIRSEVRLAHLRLRAQRQIVQRSKNVLVPVTERAVELGQLHYNGMLIGVFQLLELKRNEIHAYRQYIETVRDYWLADVALRHAVGGGRFVGDSGAFFGSGGKP